MISLGRFAFRFILAYSVISAIIVTTFVACGMPPPATLLAAPLDPQQLAQQAQSWIAQVKGFSVLAVPWLIGLAFFDFVMAMLIGIPMLFYRLAPYTGNPALAVGCILAGTLLQIAGLWYGIMVALGRVAE